MENKKLSSIQILKNAEQQVLYSFSYSQETWMDTLVTLKHVMKHLEGREA